MNRFLQETSAFLRRVGYRIGENIPNITKEQKLERQAKNMAMEAVILFVNSQAQTTKAEFSTNSQNIVDIAREKSGTIFRITTDGSGGRGLINKTNWRWIVVSKDDEGGIHLWEIAQKSTDRVPQQGGELRLAIDDIELSKTRPKSLEMKVEHILKNCWNIPLEIETPIQIDRMWGGYPEPSRRKPKERVKLAMSRLSPAPQEI